MNDTTSICPICEEGRLTPATHALTIRHAGQTIEVRDLEHSVCDACGEEPVLAAQIRRNQKKIADAKRRADQMLTGDEIAALRKRFRLTQQAAATLFGGGANAFSKYERGDVIQSVPMDRLLRLTGLCPFLLPMLKMLAGMQPVVSLDSAGYKENALVCVNDADYELRAIAGPSVDVKQTTWQAA